MKGYIIAFDKGIDNEKEMKEVKSSILSLGGQIGSDFTVINGFSFTLEENSLGQFMEEKKKHGWKFTLEEDREVHTFA
ncbi:HBR492Cp [Eremothecium sinecaudum]|uniref:HBR492Cp n=1 Tax=Eremothecium sinecaudum TaxID=45286 RepID=A0A109UXK5_9SACH|nr:HBR492Cp [Eremothecium sinecaudum]AMD19393.1 HBR492Cp [Eremothecium sinecaudum]